MLRIIFAVLIAGDIDKQRDLRRERN